MGAGFIENLPRNQATPDPEPRNKRIAVTDAQLVFPTRVRLDQPVTPPPKAAVGVNLEVPHPRWKVEDVDVIRPFTLRVQSVKRLDLLTSAGEELDGAIALWMVEAKGNECRVANLLLSSRSTCPSCAALSA